MLKSLLNGNFSPPWLLASSITVWFTAFRGLKLLLTTKVTPFYGVHLLCAAAVSYICIWNLYHTPSHGKTYRKLHKVLGQMSIGLCAVSFLTGFITGWYENYHGINGFLIGITAGGLGQLYAISMMWKAAKSGNIEAHKRTAHAVFYQGCFIPALMRLPSVFGYDFPWIWNLLSFPMALLIERWALSYYPNLPQKDTKIA
ncbi:hypothetical protein EDD86DRAFT_196735 [Gorgonomyces haynaldii]|nr:hypothetical protein EDD86DRAFT_196735 [Gorgonomyces haynaldii]